MHRSFKHQTLLCINISKKTLAFGQNSMKKFHAVLEILKSFIPVFHLRKEEYCVGKTPSIYNQQLFTATPNIA